MNEKEQKLLAVVLDLFAEKFGKKAVLRGGMVLRVLGSARYTNDLDYVFIPYKSKKEIVSDLVKCLKTIENAEVQHSLNSKCLRIVLTVENTSIQIEAQVAVKIKTAVTSTKLFSPQFQLPKRIIHIVDHSVSMANKMAAWNERRLIRDIYDIWFFLQMGIKPDVPTLEKRLKKPNYSKLIKKEDFYSGKNLKDFYEFIRNRVNDLTEKEIQKQMSDYLSPEETVGLSMFFKAAFAKLN